MKKYEYTKHMLGIDMDYDINKINELGKQGWDLVHVVGDYLIFKRELPDFTLEEITEMRNLYADRTLNPKNYEK